MVSSKAVNEFFFLIGVKERALFFQDLTDGLKLLYPLNISALLEIDVVFVGTGDLSMSLGYAGQMTHPKVLEAAELCFKATKNAGKICGVSCPEENTEGYLERGVRFFHSSAHYLIQNTGTQYMKMVQAAANKHGA